MRSLLLALFILTAPLPIDGLVDMTEFEGKEVVLVNPYRDYWGQEEWGSLEDYGYIPLRLLTPSKLIAWKVDVDVTHPYAYEEDAPKALWKSIPSHHQQVRVVFEPGLPDTILQELHNKVETYVGKQLPPLDGGHLASLKIKWDSNLKQEWLTELPGILWLEPELRTVGRNLDSAVLLSGGENQTYPISWTFGLNGTGVVVGVADTGIDADHSCFRSTSNSSIGPDHRKLLHVNTSIDDWDNSGHVDYRHGTHTAGILGCHPFATAMGDNIPPAVMSLGYDTRLVVQDIVSEEGWLPPEVDLLLAESAMYGGYLHSNSWGDDTTDYTLRSGDFDAFTREFPWTLPLIAPGNNGGFVLEPANARNVLAIGASTKDTVPDRWVSSVHGETDAETRGIFALAPGVSVVSARSDGSPDTFNAGQYTSSGTSMSTPMAAAYASVLQQMVQEGWLTGHNESLSEHNLGNRSPWFEPNTPQRTVLLGNGFVPSAPMTKALMSLSTSPLDEEFRNNGQGGSTAPNNYDGWGLLNLSEILNFERLKQTSEDIERPVSNVWIHDSYRLIGTDPSDHLSERRNGMQPIEYLMENVWDGAGAIGPFISTGDVFQQRFILQNDESLDVRLSFQAKPEPHLVDDVQLMVRLPDGRFAVGENYRQDGRSMLYYDFADHLNTTAFPSSNETTVGIHLDAGTLADINYVDVIVSGRYVAPGNQPNTLGVEGNRIGFALAVQGVEIDPLNHSDGDGDGIPYEQDSCPFTNALGWDLDSDGCIDDNDADGVDDNVDACLSTPKQVPVEVSGCSQQNNAPRIFLDESVLMSHDNETISILFSILDDDVVNATVVLQSDGLPTKQVDVCSLLVTNDSWKTCVAVIDQDFFPLNAEGNWTALILASDFNSSSWTTPASASYRSDFFTIHPDEPVLATQRDSNSLPAIAILTSITIAVLFGFIAQYVAYRKEKEGI